MGLIPFNVPFDNRKHFGSSLPLDATDCGRYRGAYAEKVEAWFRAHSGSAGVVLTASCTNALELAALALDIRPGDEVIVPSFTFVSSANAFVRQGARPVLCDSEQRTPNLDLDRVEELITPRTRALVVVHYAGASVDMNQFMDLARHYRIPVVEDAAQCIDSYYRDVPLGTFGDLGALSFHETKNVSCGQGGLLLVNNLDLMERIRVLRDCGTNRHQFQLGKIRNYSWIDIGSVFNLSEVNCAYLYPQLQAVDRITEKRRVLWNAYFEGLLPLREEGRIMLPIVDPRSRHNAHIFWVVVQSRSERDQLLHLLEEAGIQATFHYDGLHRSHWYTSNYGSEILPNAEKYGDCLARLPLHYDLELNEVAAVVERVHQFVA